jgi:uncharacterized membrane protein YczE
MLRRLVRLYTGLVLYGVSDAMLVRAALGLDPWDVFHQGLAERFGIGIGTVSVIVGAMVLLLWWPLRQRPRLGTLSNVVVVGGTIDAVMAVLPYHPQPAVRIPLLILGVLLNGVATGLYISARYGPGPRDGLMTGLHRRTGRSLRLIRTGIELGVLTAGYLLGGGVGVGTVLYAVAIGPLAQFFLHRFDAEARKAAAVRAARGGGAGGRRSPVPVPPAATGSAACAEVVREPPEASAVDPV